MPQSSDLIDRLAPMYRPQGRPAGHHTWSNLLFLHWQVPAYELESKVPESLTIDTFNGKAWVGLVLFHMSGVRPWWFPAVPGISSFHETNVRTYVHRDGEDPGVWFFSLDASSSLAVSIAQRRWNLPYYSAEMKLKRDGRHLEYAGERLVPGDVGPNYSVTAEIGDALSQLNKDIPDGQAVPGTLEYFLAERYLLYATDPEGRLYKGQVHHKPYPLCEARVLNAKETMLDASDISVGGEMEHVVFSEGVDVDVFPLRRLR